MLDDGAMLARDGIASRERLVEYNARLAQVIRHLMREERST